MTTDTPSDPTADLSERYDPSSIEPKWRARWEADELYRNFRGADPSIEPLLEGRGFDVEGAGGGN